MKKKKYLLLVLFIISYTQIFAEKKFTISGSIKNAQTGEALIGVSLFVKENPKQGVNSNDYGFFSLSLDAGKYTILTHYLGYEDFVQEINLTQNISLNIELREKRLDLKEVIITSEKNNKNVSSTDIGVNKLELKEIRNIPVLFGEQDILKTIQLLPGIKSAGEGNTGFYVRGGGADQNLILLDEAPVYNPSHLLGFFSVFNSDAIKNVSVYKGGIPAEYGGRISSVLDIKMNDGNKKQYHASGGIGLISSRLTLEGPIIKDKGSFIISGRRTYADLFLKLSSVAEQRNSQLYFYDLNLKANYEISSKDHVYLSGYFGRDHFDFNNRFGFEWGNATATFRWNHIYNDKLFSNTSLIYSNYGYNISNTAGDNKVNIESSIIDFNLKEDFQYFISSSQKLKFGMNAIHHTFAPGEVSSSGSSVFNNIVLDKKFALENAAYIADEFDIGAKIKVDVGLRFSAFSLIGPANIYTYDQDGNTLDTTVYGENKFIKTYAAIEPRINTTFIINDYSSVKASYNKIHQYLSLLSNSTSTSPTDLWVPASNNIKPQIGGQISLGYFRNFLDNKLESSIEVYYKNLQNQIDYKNGADLRLNKKIESQLLYGTGRAYGIEFFVKKKLGKFTGWVGYTLSRTERTFTEIDSGKSFPAKQDRTHDISLVGIYDISQKWNFSATFVYSTGNAVTFPSGKYQIGSIDVPYYTERNGYRMPSYNRMDVSATYYFRRTEKRESSLNFSIYNIYNRANPYFIYFRQNASDPSKTEAVQVSLFQLIPSVTYNFKF